MISAPRLLLLALLLLSGCAGMGIVPFSGASGPNGGSEEAIYYDRTGHPHFQL